MKLGELFVRLGADFSQYDKDLKKAEGMAQASGNTIGNVFRNAVSFALGKGIFEAAKDGFKSIMNSSIGFNKTMQTATIGFTTMLGSAEKAESFLAQVADFAKSTPFEFPELLDNAKRMLAFGFSANEVLPTLRAVGDAAAGLGSGKVGIDRISLALGQIKAKGKLAGEEMRQLTEAGVPAWQMLADAIGITVPAMQEMVSKGMVPADKAVKILTDGMNKRFGGMMAKMEDSWEGVTSSIKDIWRMTIGSMTQNLFKGANQWLIKVRDFSQKFYDAFKDGGLKHAIQEVFGKDIAKGLVSLGNVVKSIWNAVKGFTGFVLNNWTKIAPIINGIVIAMVSYKIATWGLVAAQKGALIIEGLTKLWVIATSALHMLRAGASLATVAQWGLNAAMAANPIGLLTIAIAGLITAGIALWRNWDKVSRFFVNAWGYMKIGALYGAYGIIAAIRWILAWIPSVNKAMSRSMQSLGASIEKEKAIMVGRKASLQASDSAQKKAGKTTNDFTDGIENQTDAMGELNKVAKDNLQSFDEVHQIQKDMATGFGDAIFPTLDIPTLDNMQDVDEATSQGFSLGDVDLGGFGGGGAFETGLEETKGIWTRFSDWFKDSLSNIKSNSSTIWSNIVTDISGKWNTLKNNAAIVWGNIKDNISSKWDNLKSNAPIVWGNIKTNIENTWTGLKTNSGSTWDSIKTNITSRWDVLKENASSIWGAIKTKITENWESLKSNAPIVWGNIKTSISDKWDELKNNASETWGNIKTAIQTGWSEISTNAPIAWENIKLAISGKWGELKENAATTWGTIKDNISDMWSTIQVNAPVVWGDIKDSIVTTWNSLSGKSKETWGGIRDTIVQKWNELKINAPAAWEDIKNSIIEKWGVLKTNSTVTWNSIKDIIVKTFSKGGYVSEAFSWGKNLVQNIIDGINSMINKVKDAARNVADGIKGFLGFSSPTKEGPGRFADEWAPNLIKMYADGIIKNAGLVKVAASEVAGNLAGMNAVPAFAGTGRIPNSFGQSEARSELHLHVGTLVADDYGLKKLEQLLSKFRISEGQREGDI